MPSVLVTFPYLHSMGPQLEFISDGVKAGPLFCRPPLSVMYSHSQRGICSVAPLTLPSRELSRACVYLPLFVLRSPRPGKTQVGGGGKGSHAVQHRRPRTTHAKPRARCPKTQTVASLTCAKPLPGPEVSTVVEVGTREENAGPPQGSAKTLVEGGLFGPTDTRSSI